MSNANNSDSDPQALAEKMTPEDAGRQPGDELPFLFTPARYFSPLVISFPHVGLDWPKGLGPRPQVNFPRNADYDVHRLYRNAARLGAATLRSRYTRLVIDLNRPSNDVSRDIVPDHPSPAHREFIDLASSAAYRTGRPIRNRGVLWRHAVGNIPLFDTISYEAFDLRLREFYWPYHRALETLLERRVQKFGYAILLDAHSMPGSVGEDLVLSTRDGTAAGSSIKELAVAALQKADASNANLRFRLDDPYRGGELIRSFGRPQLGYHALQLEVNRALYMDENRLELWPLPRLGLQPERRASSSNFDAQFPTRRPRLSALLRRVDKLISALAEPAPNSPVAR